MSNKKDILFLCQFFYPEYISSATLPFDTALALKNAGYSVDALCGYPCEYSDVTDLPLRETVEGIGIHRLRYSHADKQDKLGRIVKFLSFTAKVFMHLPEIGRYRSVVVYSNPPVLPWVAGCAKKLFGTKLIFVSYDVYPEIAVVTGALEQGDLISRVMDRVNRFVFSQADAVVALSGEMKEFLCKNRPVAPEKVHVIPNWYEDGGERSGNREDNRFAEETKGRFVVSYFGNMGTIHDMDTIRGAIRRLKDNPNICFLLAGHGNKMQSFKDMVHKENFRNLMVFDFLKGKDFQDALEISDCALVCMTEGIAGMSVPSKTYSYMMQGIPMIAIMEDCDIVRDACSGAGIWVENGAEEDLVRAIERMRTDPQLVQEMQKTCRQLYLEKYTTQICTQKYVSLFRSVLEAADGTV